MLVWVPPMNFPLIKLPFFNSSESARTTTAARHIERITTHICLVFITEFSCIFPVLNRVTVGQRSPNGSSVCGRRSNFLRFSVYIGLGMPYFLRPGGKSFSSFCDPLLGLSWFFSCFLLGSIACWAAPIHTSFFAPGSYMPRTKVPMLMEIGRA